MTMPSDPQELQVLRALVEAFEKLGIRYAISGSIASSVYGQIRFTRDADITVEPFPSKAEHLQQLLKADFYISKHAMHQALLNHSSFNVIHFQTAFKIDIFIQGSNDFDRQLLARSKKLKLTESIDKLFSFVSPEDIILLKLKWYSDSGRVSERQWFDIIGVLNLQHGSLDFDYLHSWATNLGLNDLLQKAISESKP